MITAESPLLEVAARVSQALVNAGLRAVLSGGAAVSVYTDNRYESSDLDFVCSTETRRIEAAIAPLGFTRGGKGQRFFVHPEARWFVEFPPGPVSFGSTVVSDDDVAQIDTEHGRVLIVTPTQCVMDRLAAYFHWNDPQALEQAVMVARARPVDWEELRAWSSGEGVDPSRIETFEAQVRRPHEGS